MIHRVNRMILLLSITFISFAATACSNSNGAVDAIAYKNTREAILRHMDKNRLSFVENDKRVFVQEWRRGLVGLDLLKNNVMDRHWPVFSSLTNHVDKQGEVHHWLIIWWLSRDTDLPRIEILRPSNKM